MRGYTVISGEIHASSVIIPGLTSVNLNDISHIDNKKESMKANLLVLSLVMWFAHK